MTVRTVFAVLMIGLVNVACTGSDSASTTTTTTTTEVATTDDPSTSSTPTSTPAPTTDPDVATSTTESTTPTTATTIGSDGLPGESIDLFAQEGDVLGVIGVADDDVLNVRAAPGTDQEIVATAEPLSNDLVATGRARALPSSIWYEVDVDDVTGWVSVSFVAYLGATDDVTADYLSENPGATAANITDLAAIVTSEFASTDPPSRVVQAVAPTTGDLHEISVDVVGLGDDALGGLRLHIFATPSEDGEEVSLRTIERTLLCTRGLTGELCS